ncbi:unnamed protein product [Linum tenue]|uniref:C3H1-type domain-containing protein n=1 Tax=Linum tenue TaxID=586396 RepID=A0AAV0H006_9ROSI|nr:unnamed protein product [Linum tenue]
MAEHLASIFGTEKERVNCPFYFKIGACCHGDRCSGLHTKPSVSPTLLLSNMYQRPDMITPGVDAEGNPIHPHKIKQHFEVFSHPLASLYPFPVKIVGFSRLDLIRGFLFNSIGSCLNLG